MNCVTHTLQTVAFTRIIDSKMKTIIDFIHRTNACKAMSGSIKGKGMEVLRRETTHPSIHN